MHAAQHPSAWNDAQVHYSHSGGPGYRRADEVLAIRRDSCRAVPKGQGRSFEPGTRSVYTDTYTYVCVYIYVCTYILYTLHVSVYPYMFTCIGLTI